jgi:hypothetical protein
MTTSKTIKALLKAREFIAAPGIFEPSLVRSAALSRAVDRRALAGKRRIS